MLRVKISQFNVVCTVHHIAKCRYTNEMQHFLWMIFIFHYLALHISDYHQSTIRSTFNTLHFYDNILSTHIFFYTHLYNWNYLHALRHWYYDTAWTYQCVIQFMRWCSWWWTGDSPKYVEPINGKQRSFKRSVASRWFIYTYQNLFTSAIWNFLMQSIALYKFM